MNPKRSLFVKIVLWFFLSLVLLSVLLVGIFNLNFRLRPESSLFGRMGGQAGAVGNVIIRELYDSDYYEWGTILERFSNSYQVDFILCNANGRILAGSGRTIPGKVLDEIRRVVQDARDSMPPPPPHHEENRPRERREQEDRSRPPQDEMFRERNDRPPARLLPLPPPEKLRFSYLLRTADPTSYWAYVMFPFQENRERIPSFAFLLAASESITGNGLFFNPVPWIAMAGFILVISIILWIPLVRSITHPITRITEAAEKIARGNFDIRVDDRRSDEIGRLGSSINHMSKQLKNYIKGQKRFLGDIAHELASPIARMELGLSILEQRLNDENKDRVENIAEEVRHMSGLVNELLSFTRAELSPDKLKTETTRLAPLLSDVIEREHTDGIEIRTEIDDSISVQAVDGLLRRALSNILRNAIRYAGDKGPIEVTAGQSGNMVAITVRDSGPGVPEESVTHLFEPFYRPQQSRARKSGGVGLGLAIVKTCVQACKGTVYAKNLKPRGFAVTIELNASVS